MIAFISFALARKDEYMLTLLSDALRRQGFMVVTSANILSSLVDQATFQAINKADLFCGLVMHPNVSRVDAEFHFARSKNLPAILLIEKGVSWMHDFERGGETIVRFGRHQASSAIEAVNQKIDQARKAKSANEPNTLAWIIGGAAILGLLSMLTDDK